jgi:hypothetical protein
MVSRTYHSREVSAVTTQAGNYPENEDAPENPLILTEWRASGVGSAHGPCPETRRSAKTCNSELKWAVS